MYRADSEISFDTKLFKEISFYEIDLIVKLTLSIFFWKWKEKTKMQNRICPCKK